MKNDPSGTLLESAGYLNNVHTPLLARSRYSDGANLAINVNLTGSCNLACTYCFADGGDYGRIKDKMERLCRLHFRFHPSTCHSIKSGAVRVLRRRAFAATFPRIQEVCEQADRFSRETGVASFTAFRPT